MTASGDSIVLSDHLPEGRDWSANPIVLDLNCTSKATGRIGPDVSTIRRERIPVPKSRNMSNARNQVVAVEPQRPAFVRVKHINLRRQELRGWGSRQAEISITSEPKTTFTCRTVLGRSNAPVSEGLKKSFSSGGLGVDR